MAAAAVAAAAADPAAAAAVAMVVAEACRHSRVAAISVVAAREAAYWQRTIAESSPVGFALLPIDKQTDTSTWRALESFLETDPGLSARERHPCHA